MTNIKVICSDLDGTLLDDDKVISPDNVAAIKHWQHQGKLFGITSGRQLSGVEGALENKFVPDFIVCLNGARVQTITGQVKWNRIDNAATQKVLQAIFSYTEKMVKVSVTTGGKSADVDIPRRTLNGIKLADQLQQPGATFEKITVKVTDDQFIPDIMTALTDVPVSASWSDRLYVEVAANGINKFTGLKQALSGVIPTSQVAAIGDYGNDLAIIQHVGYGIAVANASDDIKQAADVVTLNNNESAIAQVIQTLLNE